MSYKVALGGIWKSKQRAFRKVLILLVYVFLKCHTIYVKIVRTPSVDNYGALQQANYKNDESFLIYSKRSFICDQAEVSSSSRLEMAKVWSETVILKNDENGWPLVSEI